MADAIHGNTELGATKQDLIASLVMRELKFRAKLMPTISDVSRFAVKGSKSISFPKLGSFTPVNRAEGVAGDATVISATVDTMDLDNNAYVAWIVDKMTAIQSNIEIEMELAGRAASGMGRYVDSAILTGLSAGASLSINAGVSADVTRNDILDMLEHLEGNEGILDDSVIVIGVDQKKALLKINEFSANDVFGRPVNFTGQIGALYGVPVLVHSGVAASQVFAYEKAGLAIGFQSAPSMDSQPANEFGVGAKRDAMDQLFGLMASQQGEQGAAAGKSPLIAKLQD